MSAWFDPKTILNAAHNSAVFNRRVRVLAGHVARAIPTGGTVLDLGAGDGSIAAAIMAQRPDLSIAGVDVMLRPVTRIPVTLYDGVTLPFEAQSFDHVTIVDVLHHTDEPGAVLAEAARVARKGVIVKDHLNEGVLSGPTLRFMDWVGNRGHDVVLPYNYLDGAGWARAHARAGLQVVIRKARLGIYPVPFTYLFDRKLHFVDRLVHQQ